MSKSTFKILFYLRKNYLNKEGKSGYYDSPVA